MAVRSRLIALAGVGLLLAGCGSVHSGSAAVVGDDRISMSAADEATEGYCVLTAQNAAAQGSASVPAADVRRQALTVLILEKVADQVAEREQIKVVDQPLESDELERARQIFGDKTDTVVPAVERNQRVLAVAVELAKKQLEDQADEMSDEELQQLGQQLLMDEAEKLDIDIDPRFGMDSLTDTPAADGSAPTGSLSVAGPALEDEATPDVLECRA